MTRVWLALLFTVLPCFAQVRITYLANEGVLLTYPGAKVLIDALFRDSLGDYLRHSPAIQEQLEAGKPPFEGIPLALATHYHLDHWDAGAITRFLRMNPRAAFASTPQATGMLPREVRARVRALWPEDGAPARFETAGVRVEAIPLEHGETQNLALRLTGGGRVVVHLGDAQADRTNFARLLATSPPDVALVPFWWLLDEEGREFLKRWKPRHVAAIHFGEADTAISAPKLRAAAPDVWLCIKPGESRSF